MTVSSNYNVYSMLGLNAVSYGGTADSKLIRSLHNNLVIFSVMIISLYMLPVADKMNKITNKLK